MTPQEHSKESRRLTGAVTRARNKVATLTSLAEKVEQKRVVRAAEEALRQHRLNYHSLVTH